jgi:hypothetical protein
VDLIDAQLAACACAPDAGHAGAGRADLGIGLDRVEMAVAKGPTEAHATHAPPDPAPRRLSALVRQPRGAPSSIWCPGTTAPRNHMCAPTPPRCRKAARARPFHTSKQDHTVGDSLIPNRIGTG